MSNRGIQTIPDITKRKRNRSDSVLRQKLLHLEKIPKKQSDNTQLPPKIQLHNDCGPTEDSMMK